MFTPPLATEFKKLVETGADDAAVAEWISRHAKVKKQSGIVQWSNQLRYTSPVDMPAEVQKSSSNTAYPHYFTASEKAGKSRCALQSAHNLFHGTGN
ncbi:MAG: hypothetical protein Fur0032_15990 [Terrimicrobiaceae bacterium]